MLFWFVITLLCCVIISFRFVMSLAISSRLVLLPSCLGETEKLAVGNGGNLFCVDCGAINHVFNDCWALSTFVPLVELLAGPEVVLLIRVQGSKQPLGLRCFVRWAAGAALQRELAKQKTRRMSEIKIVCSNISPSRQGCGRSGSAALPASAGKL